MDPSRAALIAWLAYVAVLSALGVGFAKIAQTIGWM